jgi:hypothetical protein
MKVLLSREHLGDQEKGDLMQEPALRRGALGIIAILAEALFDRSWWLCGRPFEQHFRRIALRIMASQLRLDGDTAIGLWLYCRIPEALN